MIDTHTHIPNTDGVDSIILIGTNLADSKRNIELAEKDEKIYASIGIYPHEEIGRSVEEMYQGLNNIVTNRVRPYTGTDPKNAKFVAIGECGLDYKGALRKKDEQKELFRMQIGLAIQHNLPLIIHSRESFDDVIEELSRYKKYKSTNRRSNRLRGVLHSFVGDNSSTLKVEELGLYVSFNGIITYRSAKYLEKVIKIIPIEKILIETDSPFLVPEPLRSKGIKKNEPKNVKLVAEKIAEIKGVSVKEIGRVTSDNARRLFGIKR